MNARVDLVADVGEGFGAYRMGDDAQLMKLLSSANVACGFHAGDPRIMERTVGLCVDNGVSIGAHPGFPDMVGFGRRQIDATEDEIRTDVMYQLGALEGFARARGRRLAHVTAHGRLGNLAVLHARYADPVAEAIAQFDPNIIVLCREGALSEAARSRGLKVAGLAFADRTYIDAKKLVPRSEPGAVITDPDDIAQRVLQMVTSGKVASVTGETVEMTFHSVLLHGDNPRAVDVARAIRNTLNDAAVEIISLPELVATSAD